ncbi:Os01g0511700, partial [Oryza sativa Japonica Group]
RRRGGMPFPWTSCGTRHSGLRLSSSEVTLIPFTSLSNPCEGRRLRLHRLQAVDCGRYTGGDEETRG